MYTLLLTLSLASFLFALILTPVCRDLCVRFGVLDRPDAERKLHRRAVPRLGGIPVALSYMLPFLIISLLPLAAGAIPARLPFNWQLLAAVATVFAIGLLDDVRGLKPYQKLLGQLGAAGLAWWGGVRIAGIHGYAVGEWVGLVLTLTWLVGCSNAFNLIDGIDGLAAGTGVVATSTVVLSAVLQHHGELALVAVPLAASLAGFLCYNFSPASIFLGDAGSLLVGFLLGCYAVLWSEKSTTILGMMAPLTALALPLLDTTLAIVRRFVRRQPIFLGDRSHIHHKLLDRGLTPRRAVLFLYGCCAVAAAFSLLQSLPGQLAGLAVVAFGTSACFGIQRLGYVELGALSRMFNGVLLRGSLHANVQLLEFRDALLRADSPEDCWLIVRRFYKVFGFNHVSLTLAGKRYSDRSGAETGGSWTMVIPLSHLDSAQLSRNASEPHSVAIVSFADTLGSVLRAKGETFSDGGPERAAVSAEPQLFRRAAVD